MFRLWGKIYKNTRLVRDASVSVEGDQNRTKKVFEGLSMLCRKFDLAEPIWLDKNVKDFKRHSRTRFKQDNFIERVDFDYFEIQVIEEDDFS